MTHGMLYKIHNTGQTMMNYYYSPYEQECLARFLMALPYIIAGYLVLELIIGICDAIGFNVSGKINSFVKGGVKRLLLFAASKI